MPVTCRIKNGNLNPSQNKVLNLLVKRKNSDIFAGKWKNVLLNFSFQFQNPKAKKFTENEKQQQVFNFSTQFTQEFSLLFLFC